MRRWDSIASRRLIRSCSEPSDNLPTGTIQLERCHRSGTDWAGRSRAWFRLRLYGKIAQFGRDWKPKRPKLPVPTLAVTSEGLKVITWGQLMGFWKVLAGLMVPGLLKLDRFMVWAKILA